MVKENSLQLTDEQIEFLKYCIANYHDNFNKAKIKDANDYAIPVLLEIANIINSTSLLR